VSDRHRRIDELLTEHGFLVGVSAGTLALLSEQASIEEFDPGALLLREGEDADTIYFITRGRVAIEIHSPSQGPIVIDTVEPGHIVGLSWVAAPFRWQFDARALESVEAVTIDALRLSEELAVHPEVAAELHRRLAAVMLERLQATRIRLLDLYANAGRR
jgi:CRP/FNR family transcriptional regulator, cyclic AMP receptor protein